MHQITRPRRIHCLFAKIRSSRTSTYSIYQHKIQGFCNKLSPSNRPPSVLDGYEGWKAFINRCTTRCAKFQEYRQANAFPSSSSLFNYLRSCIQFSMLQLPTVTEIDLLEFLNGAQHAFELVTRSLYTPEFQEYADYYHKNISVQQSAPKCVTTLRNAISKTAWEKLLSSTYIKSLCKHRATLEALEIEKIHFTNVYFSHLPNSKYLSNPALQPINSNIQEHKNRTNDELAELLILSVVVHARKRVICHTKDSKQDVDFVNISRWSFVSRVNDFEDLDWRIYTTPYKI